MISMGTFLKKGCAKCEEGMFELESLVSIRGRRHFERSEPLIGNTDSDKKKNSIKVTSTSLNVHLPPGSSVRDMPTFAYTCSIILIDRVRSN